MLHKDRIILEKVTQEIDIATSLMNNTDFDTFNSNEMLKRAICMTVINIGELVKSLSAELRAEHKQIPWKSIAGFRDIAAHKYQTLHMKDVYITVQQDFPMLKGQIADILA